MYNEGDKSQAICPKCKKVVATTMEIRNVPMSGNKEIVVPGIMVAVCDDCGCVVGIPQQSAITIKETIESL